MWKDFFSSIGLDSVKVDTIVEKQLISPGETLSGHIHVKGGQADEPIDKIHILLYLQYEAVKEDSDFSWHEKHFEEIIIPFKRNIKAYEEHRVPFSVKVPLEAPKTDDTHKWFVRTKVFIDQAVDPEDEDEITVQ
ncbi:sporulation protein [Domibacillus robiginosus]|uniref:sporulation protein n=1 Tax=Domibacillus robiginosus TaxID=1071054 RepID=UPI00067C78D4|nr:sporulation protein [Domibacillus robiginosus]